MVDVVLDLYFGYAFAAFHHFVERVAAAQFEDDIDIFGVFEDVVEHDYVFVLEGSVDFDFCD